MYCENCGMHNDPGRTLCHLCSMDLHDATALSDGGVHVDLSQLPVALVLDVVRSGKVSPLFCCRSILSKIRGKPFFVPVLNSIFPRLHHIDDQRPQGAQPSDWLRTHAFLCSRGFGDCALLQDRSFVFPVIHRLMMCPERGEYCSIHTEERSGAIRRLSFFSVNRDRTITSVDSVRVLPIIPPPSFKPIYMPGKGIEVLFRVFSSLLPATASKPLTLELRNLLPILRALRTFTVERGVEQALLSIRPAGRGVMPVWL